MKSLRDAKLSWYKGEIKRYEAKLDPADPRYAIFLHCLRSAWAARRRYRKGKRHATNIHSA